MKNTNNHIIQDLLLFSKDLMCFSRDILIYLSSARYNLERKNQSKYIHYILEADKELDASLVYQKNEINRILELSSLPDIIRNQLKQITPLLNEIEKLVIRLDNWLDVVSIETKVIVNILTRRVETLREQVITLDHIIVELSRMTDTDSHCSIT